MPPRLFTLRTVVEQRWSGQTDRLKLLQQFIWSSSLDLGQRLWSGLAVLVLRYTVCKVLNLSAC